ncbi:hypothetical protein FA95DRAFT_1309596 [Auriscalpium vulgare]|uniref:Uncharacterized protein n=1 Tax=Auriscalpium vulgare TaxID=40419 RepID=A0ACB8RRV7_9AGAM|nr:hypothetical protein FA95DRAFT_1309596 [Auriscalpium vulgare]
MASAQEEPPVASTSTAPTVIEYKKDGTVSRIRSHKGNIPQLPQTKLCPYCPAKFTRTTHLNRHLRNHTNERSYRCETCGAQFTRSDLLARHKRSCGESGVCLTQFEGAGRAGATRWQRHNTFIHSLRMVCRRRFWRGENPSRGPCLCLFGFGIYCWTGDDLEMWRGCHPITRSRRRSCQACAALKVKCDLKQPCAKCTVRNRKCVYTAEEYPEDGPGAPPCAGMNIDASAGFDPSSVARGPRDAFAQAFPELTLIEETSHAFASPLSAANVAAMAGSGLRASGQAISLPTEDVDSTVNTIESFQPRPNRAFMSEFSGPQSHLSGFSSSMFEPFFRDVFAESKPSLEVTPPTTTAAAPPMIATPDSIPQPSLDGFIMPGMNGVDPAFGMNDDDAEPFMAEYDNELLYDMLTNTTTENAWPSEPVKEEREFPAPYPGLAAATKAVPFSPEEVARQIALPPPVPVDPNPPPEPTLEDLQQYLYVFLTAFLPQVPVLHTPSLRVELKPPILLRAMQACGALFVKTRTAEAFVDRTLSTSREVLVREFARPSPDPKHQVHIIMTLVLLQMIGLFHQDPQQRASSNIYHGMLVLMIRQNRIIERSAAWTHQDYSLDDPTALDAAWRDWAVHESIKRAVCLSYCHDQSQRIYFSLPASFMPSEFTLFLPVDYPLWSAPTAYAWSLQLNAASPYGTAEERITGVPMARALTAVGLDGPNMTAKSIGSPSPPKDIGVISAFGHFILMHALLGELFRRCGSKESPAPTPRADGEGEEQVNEHVFAMQLALHKWLQLWLNSPDGPSKPAPLPPRDCTSAGTPPVKDAPFASDPLPFYWLAQLLLLAFQEGMPPFAPRPAPSQDSPSNHGSSSSPTSTSSPSIFAPSPFASSSSSSLSPPPAYATGFVPPEVVDEYYSRKQEDPAAAQFSLIKGWLHHIRMFLRRSQGSPTVVWDELMKIRLRGWSADARESRKAGTDGGSFGDAAEGGLLGFFEEKLKL